MKSLSAEDVAVIKAALSYDPETGVFLRKESVRRLQIGRVAGSNDSYGYVRIKIGRRQFKAHALAFVLMTGSSPAGLIDHINGDPADNRWTNLRVCTQSLNLRNTALRSDNRTGIHGVHWDISMNRWVATIRESDGRRTRKNFSVFLDAVAWRKAKEIQFGYAEGHGRAETKLRRRA
ncbi:HNH endonuclease [Pseudomonas lactis]|uniref:HNH endonuclease n=1 Tax=Pseudomonas TaxID=286 RepID=UPI000BB5F028|nr:MULTISPECIES: HNH endonuclease [Pseudomonas]MBA5956261.1 HNH endonuclease [Pseudomonas lactis]PRW80109.1 Fis family transcriptional regulator [Pseudomonas fluorescens]PRW80884.1 Fis family transcriptional regulator [Pseudomonas fluorescens]